MLRLVVLVSGGGTNFADLLARINAGSIPAEVVAVGADRECGGLEIARRAGIETFIESFTAPREAWSARLADQITAYDPDLVVLSGFMRLLAPEAVARLAPKLINTHPSLLPEFPGAHAVRDALESGAQSTGASVIVVDEGVDTGPVLAQRKVLIRPGDDEAALHERIKHVERDLLAGVIAGVASGTIDLHAFSGTDRQEQA